MKVKSSLVALLVAALLVVTLPARQAQADDMSTGAVIALGLMGVVVGVYFLVALQDDMDGMGRSAQNEALQRAVAQAEASPVVVDALRAPLALGGSGETAESLVGASIGWRWQF